MIKTRKRTRDTAGINNKDEPPKKKKKKRKKKKDKNK